MKAKKIIFVYNAGEDLVSVGGTFFPVNYRGQSA